MHAPVGTTSPWSKHVAVRDSPARRACPEVCLLFLTGVNANENPFDDRVNKCHCAKERQVSGKCVIVGMYERSLHGKPPQIKDAAGRKYVSLRRGFSHGGEEHLQLSEDQKQSMRQQD